MNISKFVNDDKGATAIEYGLIVASIAAVIILTVSALGVSLQTMFDGLNNLWP